MEEAIWRDRTLAPCCTEVQGARGGERTTVAQNPVLFVILAKVDNDLGVMCAKDSNYG